MTSGGYSMTEGWNLQLQGRVRELEVDLAEAEQKLRALTEDMRSSAKWTLARAFLDRMEEKRNRAARCAADIEALLQDKDAAA